MKDPSVFLTEADQGHTIGVHVGQTVSVTLPENATAGYRWSPESVDAALIEAGQPTASYPTGQLGSGGTVEWRYSAKAPGTSVVALKLWREWEGDSSIIRRFQVTLSITQ